MDSTIGLHLIDWGIVGGYLLFALGVGVFVREAAGSDKESYFLAGRSLPWWWAGASIAATTFAADTPLVVTGETASRGLSGNWLWLSWIGLHAAAFVFFAAKWSRSGTITDAELVDLRYSGDAAGWLRIARALLYGVVYNGIILGWVLNAMVKICKPFFRWEEWTPRLMELMAAWWPSGTELGAPEEGFTILVLVALVGLYSTLGGIRGVIFTDLVQLTMALFGSTWFAWRAWVEVGGRSGLVEGLAEHYEEPETYLAFFPNPQSGWLEGVGDWLGAGLLEAAPGVLTVIFGGYLVVQSYANFPADGGGYLMQRLNTCRDSTEAKRASLFFILIHYLLRVWPWFVVALAALVLIPKGMEAEVFGGAAAAVGENRELAYPVLMGELLGPGVLGILLTSLLAAFMSTIDTHINWGASYMVNDVYLAVKPDASDAEQVRFGRFCVVGFVLLAIVVAMNISTIGAAYRWLAIIGAAVGVPTALRWLWWRVTASAELWAIFVGLTAAVLLKFSTEIPYELLLLCIAASSVVGMFLGFLLAPGGALGGLVASAATWVGLTVLRAVVEFVAGRPELLHLTLLGADVVDLAAACAGLVGTAAGFALGPTGEASGENVESFMDRVEPDGVWPDRPLSEGLKQIGGQSAIWFGVCTGVLMMLGGSHQLLLMANYVWGSALVALGAAALWGATIALDLSDITSDQLTRDGTE